MSGECPLCHADEISVLFQSRDRVHGLPGTFTVFRCRRCDAVSYLPRLRSESLASYYPRSYGRYRLSRSLGKKKYRGLRRFVLENYYGYPPADGAGPSLARRWIAGFLSFFAARGAIPYRGGGNFLDLGCGAGSYLYRLREWGWNVYGVETNPAGVEQARSLGLTVHLGEVTEANFPDSFFDVIRLHHVLEHISKPRAVFMEIRRILRASGIVEVTVPNTRSLNFRLFGADWYGLDIPRHVISYCPKALAFLCRDTGFEIIHLRCRSGPFGFVRSVKYFFEEGGNRWPAWLRRIDWARSRPIRRALKPLFSMLDVLGLGDVMVATLTAAGQK